MRVSVANAVRANGLLASVEKARAASLVRPGIALAFDTMFAVLDCDGWRDSSATEVVGGLVAEQPWGAAVLVGHGAEHCLALGDAWIAASSDYGLRGRILHPDMIKTPTLMLYACGTLRPPGICCPESMHLASRLAVGGACVLGPFRNLRPMPEAACAFAEGFAAGDPLGLLRQRLDELYAAPTFALLGDPETRMAAFRPQAARPLRPKVDAAATAVRKVLARATKTAALLDHLSTWDLPGRSRELARIDLQRARTQVLRFFAGDAKCSDSTRGDVEAAATAALSAALSDLSANVSEGRWLEAAYGPVTRLATAGTRPCPLCGGDSARQTRHSQPGVPAVMALECDTCGSIEDRMGSPLTKTSFEACLDGDLIVCDLPALPLDAHARLLLHRGGGVCADWPRDGGRAVIRPGAAAPRGRITVVALAIAPGGLQACYRHLWRSGI